MRRLRLPGRPGAVPGASLAVHSRAQPRRQVAPLHQVGRPGPQSSVRHQRRGRSHQATLCRRWRWAVGTLSLLPPLQPRTCPPPPPARLQERRTPPLQPQRSAVAPGRPPARSKCRGGAWTRRLPPSSQTLLRVPGQRWKLRLLPRCGCSQTAAGMGHSAAQHRPSMSMPSRASRASGAAAAPAVC
ncbi:hypothetical protein F751_3421 [Auxenochlorella protothecoides]|uniref:Uncharacterized protein n=1 Tax=Auxenochlorella protothecoides TaxID=3075 RepID=A0A087SBX6_AUXPR|nr:hypothetical protein F751_3421 [Auxenochlorella protothecoides]KFM23230.1 hypothetical protein F751_3421 [Auxenochlorella protothecoides]